MTHRTVCNQTSKTVKHNGTNTMNEQQIDGSVATPNNPNSVNFATSVGDGTPIVYKSYDHRPCGTKQADENPIP